MPRLLHNHDRLLARTNGGHLPRLLDRALPAHRWQGSVDGGMFIPAEVEGSFWRHGSKSGIEDGILLSCAQMGVPDILQDWRYRRQASKVEGESRMQNLYARKASSCNSRVGMLITLMARVSVPRVHGLMRMRKGPGHRSVYILRVLHIPVMFHWSSDVPFNRFEFTSVCNNQASKNSLNPSSICRFICHYSPVR